MRAHEGAHLRQGALTRLRTHRNTGTHSAHLRAHASSHARSLPRVRTAIHTQTYPPRALGAE